MIGTKTPKALVLFPLILGLAAFGCGRSQLGGAPDAGLPDTEPPVGCTDDSECDDGNPCNGRETCELAECAPGTPIPCEDDVDCTADTCDETSGECLFLPDHSLCERGALCDEAEGCRRQACTDSSQCDDGAFCNGSEFCIDGHCEPGVPPSCDDGIGCTSDRCDPAINGCAHRPDDALCDDGRFCDGVETCDMTIGCRPGAPVACDDADACTTDTCDDEIDRCVHDPVDRDRDGFASCGCAGPPCDCDDGDVTVNPGMIEQCRDLRDNDCDRLVDCDDVEDCSDDPRCGAPPCVNNIDCDDSIFCNGYERCVDGRCIAGTPPSCDDSIDCTVDTCVDDLESCTFVPDDSLCGPGERCDRVFGCMGEGCSSDRECDNGLYCDGAELCDAATGLCVPGPAVACADRFDCTEDRCDEALDTCSYIPRDGLCDNGLFCDGEESCEIDRGCVEGDAPCTGGTDCIVSICLEEEGRCARAAVDLDGDDFAPIECGGRDCDDTNPRISPRAAELCDDGADNDCNGFADCDDGACRADIRCCEPTGREICDDDIDNDCDGDTDCDDLRDCRSHDACCVPTGDEVCDDEIDNDCDGFMDCSDFFDCRRDPVCDGCIPELCWDSEDNDCDELVDCEDPDCAWFPPCDAPDVEMDCHNRVDDDLDGDTDCDDSDCDADPMCPEPDTCDDAIFIGDEGEIEVTGSTFTLSDDYAPVESPDGECRGGAGSDAVFFIDLDDPAHIHIDTFGSDFDTVLYVRDAPCDDGLQLACNDDTDGLQSEVDFVSEPATFYIFVDGYGPFSRGDFVLHVVISPLGDEVCDNDLDDDGDGMVDCDDEDCDGSPDCIPLPERGVAACTDGDDNDLDGLVDCDDTEDCAVVDFTGECCDGEDDNGNGVVDEFVCACTDGDECDRGNCYVETVGACGPSCTRLGGDTFCDWIFPGTSCSRATGTCVY